MKGVPPAGPPAAAALLLDGAGMSVMSSPTLLNFLLCAGTVVLLLFLGLKWLLLSAGGGSRESTPDAGSLGRRILPDCPHCGSPGLVARHVGLGIRHICRHCRREAMLR